MSFLEDMNEHLDQATNTAAPTVITQNNSNELRERSLALFYEKLEEMGINLEEMRELLESDETTLVTAGAGSGKTTVLTLKIIRDLISGTMMVAKPYQSVHGLTVVHQPAKILVSTFLKTGAQDLQASLREWCTKLGVTGVDFSTIEFKTIHAEIKSAIESMTGQPINVITDTMGFVREVAKKYSIRSVNAYTKTISADEVRELNTIMQYARNRMDNKRYEHPLAMDYGLNTLLMDNFLRDFQSYRQSTRGMDFEDMQETLLMYLRTNPNVETFISNRYDYVFVDEFQDVSQLQYEVLKYYFRGAKRTIVVGDPDQCLVEGTLIHTDRGFVPVEQIKVGDMVKTSYGSSGVQYGVVDHVSASLHKGEIIKLTTETGKILRGTGNHIGFAINTQTVYPEGNVLAYTMFDEQTVNGELSRLGFSTKSPEVVKLVHEFIPMFAYKLGNKDATTYLGSLSSHKTSELESVRDKLLNLFDYKNLPLTVINEMRIAGEEYPVEFDFVQFKDIKEGYVVSVLGSNDKQSAERIVKVEVEDYEGVVYDFSVPETRNYSANGIIVHNCIYSFRGSENDIILKYFREDFNPKVVKLTTNYRCHSNIVNFVKPSIVKNGSDHSPYLKSFKEGGEVHVLYNTDVNHLIESVRNDLANQWSVGVLGRTNGDLLIPAIILELDGGVEFSVSKAVNMTGRMAKQIFGMFDLITQRASDDLENLLKVFLKRYDWYEAEKLANTLYMNRGLSLYNMDDRDLKHSVPKLYPILKNLREAYAIDGVTAFLYLLGVMEQNVYTGDSNYSKKARELTALVRKLITEHNSLKNLSITELDMLFRSTLPERLSRRANYTGASKIKLTTVHEAKGKEWDSVYIWNNSEGVFPAQVGTREITADEYEEERRVHYIACTRAKYKSTHYTNIGRVGDFLMECDTSIVANPQAKSEQQGQEDGVQTENVFSRPVSKEQARHDYVKALACEYLERVMASGEITDIRVANLQIVINVVALQGLINEALTKYGMGEDNTSKEDAFTLFDDICQRLADSLLQQMSYDE